MTGYDDRILLLRSIANDDERTRHIAIGPNLSLPELLAVLSDLIRCVARRGYAIKVFMAEDLLGEQRHAGCHAAFTIRPRRIPLWFEYAVDLEDDYEQFPCRSRTGEHLFRVVESVRPDRLSELVEEGVSRAPDRIQRYGLPAPQQSPDRRAIAKELAANALVPGTRELIQGQGTSFGLIGCPRQPTNVGVVLPPQPMAAAVMQLLLTLRPDDAAVVRSIHILTLEEVLRWIGNETFGPRPLLTIHRPVGAGRLTYHSDQFAIVNDYDVDISWLTSGTLDIGTHAEIADRLRQ